MNEWEILIVSRQRYIRKCIVQSLIEPRHWDDAFQWISLCLLERKKAAEPVAYLIGTTKRLVKTFYTNPTSPGYKRQPYFRRQNKCLLSNKIQYIDQLTELNSQEELKAISLLMQEHLTPLEYQVSKLVWIKGLSKQQASLHLNNKIMAVNNALKRSRKKLRPALVAAGYLIEHIDSVKQAKRIRELHSKGVGVTQLAVRFGLSKPGIGSIVYDAAPDGGECL